MDKEKIQSTCEWLADIYWRLGQLGLEWTAQPCITNHCLHVMQEYAYKAMTELKYVIKEGIEPENSILNTGGLPLNEECLMDFKEAVKMMREGFKLTRKSYEGNGVIKYFYILNNQLMYKGYGKQRFWRPSLNDIEAKDWEFYEEE